MMCRVCLWLELATAFVCLQATAGTFDGGVSLGLPPDVPVCSDCLRGSGGTLPKHESSATVTWRTNAVEIVVSRVLAPGERPRSVTVSPPVAMFGKCETAEVLLAPHPEAPDRYYHLAANAAGVVYTACRRETAWQAAKPIAVRPFVETNRWGVSFTIPFGAFGEKPVAKGAVWGANFGIGPDAWTAAADWHDVRGFGELRFGGRPPAARVASVRQADDGRLHFAFETLPPQTFGEVGHKGTGALEYALTSRGEPMARFSLSSGPGDGEWLTLDSYYYPEGVASLAYAAKNFTEGEVSVRELVSGRVVSRTTGGGTGTVDFAAAGVRLTAGEYVFEIDDGTKRTACQFAVQAATVLPRPIAGSLRTKGTLLVADFEGVGERAVCPVIGSEFHGSDYNSRPILAIGYRRGDVNAFVLNGRLPLYGGLANLERPSPTPLETCRLGYEVQFPHAIDTGAAVTAIVDRAAFFADVYRTLKRRFPKTLFSIEADNDHPEFLDACDVLEFAVSGCSYQPDVLRALPAAMDMILKRPVVKPSVFWLGAAVPAQGRYRTADEINTAIRYCILRGVTGVIFNLAHGGVDPRRTRIWSLMRGVDREIATWYPDWAAGLPDDRAVVSAENGVAVAARHTPTGTLVLAANLKPHARSFVVREGGGTRTVRLPGSGSALIRMK